MVRSSLRSIYCIYCFVLLCCIGCIYNSVEAQSVVSIDQVVEQTVNHNPQIRVSLQNIEYSKGSYRVARSDFNTQLFLNGYNSKSITPTSLEEPLTEYESTTWSTSLSASRKIPFGTVISPSLGLLNTGQDLLYQQLDNTLSNQGSLFLNLQQPLLQGLGNTYNLAGMRMAKLDISSQEHRYLYDASYILLNALGTYLDYIAAQLNLRIQIETEASIAETVRQLTRLVELDAIPGSELIVSQANLANQKTNLALAENRLALSQNLLATAMGITLADVKAMGEAPADFPADIALRIIDEEFTNYWMTTSMEYRHDFLAVKNELEISSIGLDYYKKSMLPRLNLNVGAGYNGLYQAQDFDQYYRPFVSNLPGMSYSIGLTFDISPRYDLQKGQRLQAMSRKEAAGSKLQYQELLIKKDVRRDCDLLKFLLSATTAVQEAVDFNRMALDNEKKKLDMGLSTSFNVALMQNTYLNALVRRNDFLSQLNQAILQFKFDTGTLIDATGDNTFTVNSGQMFVMPQEP